MEIETNKYNGEIIPTNKWVIYEVNLSKGTFKEYNPKGKQQFFNSSEDAIHFLDLKHLVVIKQGTEEFTDSDNVKFITK